MLKIKKILILLSLIFIAQIHPTDFISKIPSNYKILGSSLIVGLATYKIHNIIKTKKEKKLQETKLIQEFNDETLKSFSIDKDTVIAFDLHDVIAKYDINKMILTSLKNIWALCAVCYPKIFPVILRKIKIKASAQEILEEVEKTYPESNLLKKMCQVGIDISAQLKPIQGTIDIIQNLIVKGYKVVIMSN